LRGRRKSMYDGGKIIAGLIVFLGLMLFPFWYNVGNAAYKTPELELPPKAKAEKCIETTEFMRAEHMQMLDEWRDYVVRDGQRLYVSQTGKAWAMSLQNTCMDCHDTKEKFCDRCHNAAAVNPYCWDCHVAPLEKPEGGAAR